LLSVKFSPRERCPQALTSKTFPEYQRMVLQQVIQSVNYTGSLARITAFQNVVLWNGFRRSDHTVLIFRTEVKMVFSSALPRVFEFHTEIEIFLPEHKSLFSKYFSK